MAQLGPAATQPSQGYITSQEPGLSNTFAVITLPPPNRESFPHTNCINALLVLSILKCIFGSCLVITGAWHIIGLALDPVSAPIWCGLIIVVNGLFGCILKHKRSKCLSGAVIGTSITSLILDVAMLIFYVLILVRSVSMRKAFCNGEYTTRCRRRWVNGQIIKLIFLIVCDIGFSIGSIVVGCKANCCAHFGSNECNTVPLNIQQGRQRLQPAGYDGQVNLHNGLPTVQHGPPTSSAYGCNSYSGPQSIYL